MTSRTRRCALTRRVAPTESLLRFVVDPSGSVVPDVAERLPGRGIWLCADRDVVNTASARSAFAKAFRRRVTVPEDLAERAEALLAKRCVETLSLARRAGMVASGFEQVRAALAAGGTGALLIAGDCPAAEARRLLPLAGGAPVVRALRAEEMARALGREHVVYAAVKAGRLAERLAVDAARLAGFRRVADEAPERSSGKGSVASR